MKTLALALLVLFSPLHSQAGMEWKLKKATGSSSGYVRSVVDTTTDGKFSKGFIVYIEKSDTVLFEKDFERDVVTPFSFFIDCYTRNFKSSEDWIMIRFYLVSNDTVYPIQNFDTDGLFVNQWRENGMIADWRFVVGYPPPKHFHKILMCFSSPYATSSSKTTVDIILDNLRADYPNSHGLDSIVVIDRFGDPDPTPSFSVSTKKLDFDSVTVGKVKSLPLVIKNAGDDTLVVMSITSTANDFTIGPVPKKIGPADSASIDVTFKPDSSDLKVGYIIFSHNGSTISDSVLVSGFGKIPLQPALLFSNRVDFGTVSINTVIYKDTVVILRNAGSDTIRGTISVIGNGFSLRDTTLLISPMDSVAKALRFSPEIVGKLTGLLIIRSNNPTSPDTVFLTGFGDMSTGVSDNRNIPNVFSLSQNYPNPFNPSTTIEFSLPKRAFVNLTIYNTLGQVVKTLVSSEMESGTHRIIWKANNIPSGIYFYRLNAGNFVETKKMILMK